MTTDKRLKTYSRLTTIIYVLLHIKTSVKAFRLTGEGLMVQEDKIGYDL